MKQILSFNERTIFIWIGSIFLLTILLLGYADPFAIVITYFLESIVIGILNFLKMLFSSKEKNKKMNGSAIFKSFFFLIHYFFFIFVQSIFVFAMFGMSDKQIGEPFHVVDNFSYAFTIEGLPLSMGVIVAILILETIISYIKPKLYLLYSAEDLFFKPYIRVLIQQCTVLFALFFVMITGLGIIAAVILILLRLLVDLIGVYITSSDKNLLKAARFMKKDHVRSDIEAIEELKKYF